MKIGILGTRGIPNNHGGFEQFAERFAIFATELGHEVWVYCSSQHPYQEKTFHNANLIHCKDPEGFFGTAGQFVYDFNCIMDSKHRKFDIILQLGYTSSSIWASLMPKSPFVVTNMDGLEWKRTKYNGAVQSFLQRAENWAVQNSDVLIADSKGIREYIFDKYKKKAVYIPYGASVCKDPDDKALATFNLKAFSYNLIIARLEPENNIEMVIEGSLNSELSRPLVIVGNYDKTNFGRYLRKQYRENPKIIFLGSIYNKQILDNLRYYSFFYFHGHSVGGTNPSLLEAMASSCLIVAHKNIFNRAILEKDCFYFSNPSDITKILDEKIERQGHMFINSNLNKILNEYNCRNINSQYLNLFTSILDRTSKYG